MNQKQSLYQKYQCSPNDKWRWDYAQYPDVEEMTALSTLHFIKDLDHIFNINPNNLKYALDIATSHQRHNLAVEQILTCRDKDSNRLLAYSWIGRGNRTPFSDDEMAEARMAQTDRTLSGIQRIHILVQLLNYWEIWAQSCGIPILVSNSIIEEQKTFIKLHERLGFVVRGGIAYKRVIPK